MSFGELQQAASWGLGFETTQRLPRFRHLQRTWKKIQSPHNLFRDFGAERNFPTLWSVGRAQVQVPAGHLSITPEGYWRRQSKVLTAKLTGGTGVPSRRQSLRDATGSLEESAMIAFTIMT